MFFFFFNDTATTEIYTLSLHDALPIYRVDALRVPFLHVAVHSGESAEGRFWRRLVHAVTARPAAYLAAAAGVSEAQRSEEHTSELQSRQYLVCRLLLEKKKNIKF